MSRVINTNKHLKTKENRISKVAKSQSNSHSIEGIQIPQEKIYVMLKEKYNDE